MPASRKSTIPAPTLALIVLAIMVVLYGADKFLASEEQAELKQEALNHYLEGQKSLHAGKPHLAVIDFARAHALDRSNREYQLALATAQLAGHQLSAAHDTLNELLDQDSNNGRANLLMARVLAAEGRFKDDDSYYHRAIYGEWPANSPAEAQRVRLELANMLAEHGNSQELLSELLLLQAAPIADVGTEKQIARLLLQAGSAQRAVDAYRHLVHENPDDVDVYLGLGQAEILAGNYRAAENAVMAALRRRPFDERIQSQLRLVVKLASLDPTFRRLSTAEKYRRSVEILRLAQNDLNACRPVQPEGITGPITNEAAEAYLDQAETLWKQRSETCKKAPAPDDPLPLLMKKLSQ
jgi:tetratricopeptide (TPR) repeat protein